MKKYLNLLALNTGFTAGIAQILFLRELLSLFQGNEITIGIVFGSWLFWTAAGSVITGKLISSRPNSANLLGPILLAVSVILPLSIFFLRFAVGVIKPVPGVTAGLDEIAVFSLLISAGFCFSSGASFALLSATLKNLHMKTIPMATGKLYALESFGAAAGGILIFLFLIWKFDNLTSAILISMVNGTLALFLILRFKPFMINRRFLFAFFLVFIAGNTSMFYFSDKSLQFKWQNFNLIDHYESHFGKLSVIESESGKTLYNNSSPLFTVPDLEMAEESVHFAMLQHPYPVNILVIGGGFSGVIEEILKYQSVLRIDYVEQDQKLVEIAKNYFPKKFKKVDGSRICQVHIQDGRNYLKNCRTTYDIIFVNMPEPSSIQNNRYFSSEFFKIGSQRLSSSGIFTFRVIGSENFINDNLAAYLSCLYMTFKSVFPNTVVYPGESVHFFGTNNSGMLTCDPNVLTTRLRERKLKLQYLREDNIPFRLSKERVQYLHNKIKPASDTLINTDYKPIACFLNLTFWNQQHDDFLGQLFKKIFDLKSSVLVWIVVVILVAYTFGLWLFKFKLSLNKFTSTVSVFVSGFSLLGLEVLILLIYQVQVGYLYWQIAILIASFMAGMGAGATFFTKNKNQFLSNQNWVTGLMLFAHGTLFLLPVMLYRFLLQSGLLSAQNESAVTGFFLVLLFVTGILGGFIFPIAAQMYYKSNPGNTGFLYAIDLIGAMAGALIINVFIIPFAGFFNALLIISGAQILVFPGIIGISILKKKYARI